MTEPTRTTETTGMTETTGTNTGVVSSTTATPGRTAGVLLAGGSVEPEQPWLLEVAEPATGDVLATVVGGGRVEAGRAVDDAVAALSMWSQQPVGRRADVLRHVAADLREAGLREELAVLICRESGKRLAEARAEVELSAKYFDWFADALATRSGAVWDVNPGTRHEVERRPLGVVAVLTPWNFPLSIPARKIAPALAAGCSICFKPSEIAPLAGLRLAEIVGRYLPAGVLTTVVGDAETVSTAWLGDGRVRGLSFTGSTRVGRLLAAQATEHLTRCVLELGGSAPFVILDDPGLDRGVGLDRAVATLAIAKYRNNGQSCIAANRVWVPRRLLDDVVAAFTRAGDELVLGNPLDEATGLGALALPSDPARLDGLLTDAESAGATVLRSSSAVPPQGQFAAPAVCIDPPENARIVTEEIFGPACALTPYDELDTVLAAVRRQPYGLAGYVYGTDLHRASAVARQLDVGIVGVNNAAPNTPQIPFPGLKHSGLATEGGFTGLDAFCTEQTIAITG